MFSYYKNENIWAMWSFYAFKYLLDKQVSLKIKQNLFKVTDGGGGRNLKKRNK